MPTLTEANPRRRWLLAVLAAAALLGAGCGSDDEPASPQAEVGESPSAASGEQGSKRSTKAGDRKRERTRDGGERRAGDEPGGRDGTQRPRQLPPEEQQLRELLAEAAREGDPRRLRGDRERIARALRELIEERQQREPSAGPAGETPTRREIRQAVAERERLERRAQERP